MARTAAQALIEYLAEEGVEYIFGVPGAHLLPVYDALYKDGRVKTVLCRHECGAAFMAYGYAVASGKLGAVCGTVGPGATNMLTGVAAAYMDSVPVLAITAQVGTSLMGKGALQEGDGIGRAVDHVGLMQKVTKLSVMAIRGQQVPHLTRRALRTALTGRPGPVHIDLPADVQAEEVDEEPMPRAQFFPAQGQAIDEHVLGEAARLLLEAKKPAVLVGFGGRGLARDGALVKLAEQLQIPVATTLRAKGIFPEDHPLALGCAGLYGTRAANTHLFSGLDVVLALGTSLHEFTTLAFTPSFQPSRALIQVDIDPIEFGKNYRTTLGVVADAGDFARKLLVTLGDRSRTGQPLDAFKADAEYFDEPAMRSSAKPVKPQRLMRELRAALPRDAIVVADIGNTMTWAERCFQAFPEGGFVALAGLAPMGSAVASCIGIKLARPESPVVALAGDGSFLMTGMEVSTAVEHGIPVIWVVLRDKRLGMIHDAQTISYSARYISSTFEGPDFVGLANALGAKGVLVEDPADFAAAVRGAMHGAVPTVIEVPIDPNEMPPPKYRMLAMRQSLGMREGLGEVSWNAIKALWRMRKE